MLISCHLLVSTAKICVVLYHALLTLCTIVYKIGKNSVLNFLLTLIYLIDLEIGEFSCIHRKNDGSLFDNMHLALAFRQVLVVGVSIRLQSILPEFVPSTLDCC